MFEDLRETLQTMIEHALSENVNTNMPGTVVSYNAATNRAVVKPDLPKALNNGEALESSKIVEVPVVWNSSHGGQGSFTFPLQPGDPVMIAVQQRSLEGWLSGKRTKPDDPRQFDISDSVAIPGMASGGLTGHATDVVMKFKQMTITLKEDNTVFIANSQASITIDPAGNILLNAQSIQMNAANGSAGISVDPGGNVQTRGNSINVSTPSRSFVLESHKHDGVQTGLSVTGNPQ